VFSAGRAVLPRGVPGQACLIMARASRPVLTCFWANAGGAV
jgi:hypothetical protein